MRKKINLNICIAMENKNYYEDIPDDQFVPLECVNNEFLGL